MAQLGNIAAGYIKAPDTIMAAKAELLRSAQTSADRARNLTLALVMCIGFSTPFGTYLQNCRLGLCETFLRRLFFLSAVVAILTTIGIVASLLFEAIRFFREISLIDFFFGTHWSPMTALRPGDTWQLMRMLQAPRFIRDGTRNARHAAGCLDCHDCSGSNWCFSAIYTSEFASRGCVGLLNLRLRCWPAFRPWFTGFLRL